VLHGQRGQVLRGWPHTRTVRVEHGGLELDDGRLVRVVLGELEREPEGACGCARAAIRGRPARGPRGGSEVEDGALLQHPPPSQGVSSGPKITAFHSMMLSGLGEPFTPCGGSCWSRLKSRIKRWDRGAGGQGGRECRCARSASEQRRAVLATPLQRCSPCATASTWPRQASTPADGGSRCRRPQRASGLVELATRRTFNATWD
jgi:hypothetical protein